METGLGEALVSEILSQLNSSPEQSIDELQHHLERSFEFDADSKRMLRGGLEQYLTSLSNTGLITLKRDGILKLNPIGPMPQRVYEEFEMRMSNADSEVDEAGVEDFAMPVTQLRRQVKQHDESPDEMAPMPHRPTRRAPAKPRGRKSMASGARRSTSRSTSRARAPKRKKAASRSRSRTPRRKTPARRRTRAPGM